MGFQVAVVVGGPLLIGALVGRQLDETYATGPWLLLAGVLAGMAIAGVGFYFVIKRYIDANPQQPVSDAAREAGRRWEREIQERERRKEADEESE